MASAAVAKKARSWTAPTVREVQELARAVIREHQGRNQIMAQADSLLDNTFPIAWPAKTKTKLEVHSSIARQQLTIALGIMDAIPTASIYTGGESEARKQDAQGSENFANNIYISLEAQQSSRIFQDIREDQAKYGYAVDHQAFDPTVMDDLPRRADYAKAGEYLDARNRAMKKHGMPSERLPLVWRHCAAADCYWRMGERGMTVMVEIRRRYLKDLVEDQRYKETLPKLHDYYDEIYARDPAGAAATTVVFCCVETTDYVAYLVQGEDTVQTWTSTEVTTGTSLQSISPGQDTASVYAGELADVFVNPIGRPAYVVTPGITQTTRNPALRHVAIYWPMRTLINIYDHMLSWRASRYAAYLGTPYVATAPLVDQAGVKVPSGEGVTGTAPPITFEAGKLTILPPGWTIAPLIDPGGGPDEQPLTEMYRRECNLLGIPDSMIDSKGGESGFLYSSVAQTVTARLAPCIHGQEMAHRERVKLTFDLLLAADEKVALMGQGANAGEWYVFDPQKIRGLEWGVIGHFKPVKPQNRAQDLQNAALAIERKIVDWETALTELLGIEDTEKIRDRLLLDEHSQRPEVKQLLTEAALKRAGARIGQINQAAQAPTSLNALLQMTPSLLAVLARKYPPGAPGYDLLQQAMQQAGNGGGQTLAPPQPPAPTISPNPQPPLSQPAQPQPTAPPRLPLPGGRAPGQAVRPGGPRRTYNVQAGVG